MPKGDYARWLDWWVHVDVYTAYAVWRQNDGGHHQWKHVEYSLNCIEVRHILDLLWTWKDLIESSMAKVSKTIKVLAGCKQKCRWHAKCFSGMVFPWPHKKDFRVWTTKSIKINSLRSSLISQARVMCQMSPVSGAKFLALRKRVITVAVYHIPGCMASPWAPWR